MTLRHRQCIKFSPKLNLSYLSKQLTQKNNFEKLLKGLNSLGGSFLPIDNRQLIKLILDGKQNLYDNSDDAIEEVLTNVIQVDYIGNIEALLRDIRINQLRKERRDLYSSDSYVDYDTPFENEKNLKDTLLNKLKICI